MSKHKLIPYPVIAAAVRGDPEAVNRCSYDRNNHVFPKGDDYA